MGKLRDKMILELDIRGRDPKTKKSYLRSMEWFVEHFKGRNPEELGIDEIKEYQQYLLNEGCYAPRTVNTRIGGIRFFYTHVMKMWWIEKEVVRVKAPVFLPTILSEQEVADMIESTDSLLHKSVLMVLYSTGMRQAEIRALKVTDIDKNRMVINIRQGKGKRDREAHLSLLAYETLRTYWTLYRKNFAVKSDHLFIPYRLKYNGKINRCLSHTALGYIVKKAAERAGVKKSYSSLLSPFICSSLV